MVIYFFVTFASLNRYFVTRKMTKAMMMKLISSPRNAPHPILKGPMANTAVFQSSPGCPARSWPVLLALFGSTL